MDPKTHMQQPSAAPVEAAPASPHRPSREWYAKKIQETMNDDFSIGPVEAASEAPAEPAPPAAKPGDAC